MFRKITVCIPSFEEGYHLDELFQSIYQSDLKVFDYEIILCDSDSKDNTIEVFESWLDRLKMRLVITHKANASENLNSGLEVSTGDVFCRIDARARVAEDYFSTGLNRLNSLKDEVCGVGPIVEIETAI